MPLAFTVCAAMHCLQLEPVMSYNAINTYADIMYAYGVSAAIRHLYTLYIGMLIVFQLLIAV